MGKRASGLLRQPENAALNLFQKKLLHPTSGKEEIGVHSTIPLDIGDFLPLPEKDMTCRGVRLTRSTLIRAEKKGQIKTRLFRQPGSTKGRRYILRESLHAYIDRCMVDVPISSDEVAA